MPITIVQKRGPVLNQLGIFAGELQQLGKPGDGDDRQAEFGAHVLDRRAFALAAFLAVECDQDTRGFGAVATDQVDRFAYGGAGAL